MAMILDQRKSKSGTERTREGGTRKGFDLDVFGR